MFLVSGAGAPNLNTPQTYINPAIVEYPFNEYCEPMDTILQKIYALDIIDDEKHVRDSLAKMLKLHCHNSRLVAQAEGVTSGMAMIHSHHPDLVLLDIKMKDGTGFDLLEKLDNIDFRIIFITAYDQYAGRATGYWYRKP